MAEISWINTDPGLSKKNKVFEKLKAENVALQAENAQLKVKLGLVEKAWGKRSSNPMTNVCSLGARATKDITAILSAEPEVLTESLCKSCDGTGNNFSDIGNDNLEECALCEGTGIVLAKEEI